MYEAVSMSRRFFALALCFSVMGMTVVPARFLPCCCKTTRGTLGTAAASVAMSPMVLRTEDPADKQRTHHSCCAKLKRTAQATCCHASSSAGQAIPAGKAIGVPCPKCTCISEMQIVALPSVALSEKTYKLGEMALVAETPTVRPVERLAYSLPEPDQPGIVLTLQTCSLRC